MNTQTKEPKTYASTCWSIEDIKTLRPKWSDKKCQAFLEEHSDNISEQMVATGWLAIEALLE